MSVPISVGKPFLFFFCLCKPNGGLVQPTHGKQLHPLTSPTAPFMSCQYYSSLLSSLCLLGPFLWVPEGLFSYINKRLLHCVSHPGPVSFSHLMMHCLYSSIHELHISDPVIPFKSYSSLGPIN